MEGIEDKDLVIDEGFITNEEVDKDPEDLTPIEIQQKYFENLNGCDWIKYEKSTRNYLAQNIAFALFGAPTSEGELKELKDVDVQLEGYTSRQKEQVMKVYEKLSEQSKYCQNDEDIVMSVLLIVCANPKPLKFYQREPSNYWVDLHEKKDINIRCTAIFRVRKCIPTTEGSQSCRIYIDEDARVYHDWESYLANNTQPKCVLIVPENGEYKGVLLEDQKAFAVKLTVVPSPALGVSARVLSTVDTASTVASLGAVGVLGVAAFTPVGPLVLVGATVATVATGLYGLVRSSIHLHDRNMHEQSISPSDSDARGSWLNIAASSVGLASGAASTLLSKSAAAGANMTKTGQALAVSVEILRHANIVTGGAGVVNSLVLFVIKYHKHGEKPTKLELFQFTASTLFFCNAVMSNRTAQNIIEEAQTTAINDYRDTLRSNRHRKIFDKLSAESRRIQGVIEGNTEVIRGIKNISNRHEYFADVLKINKDINAHKVRISMTADGQVNLNGQYKYNPSDLYSMGKETRSELLNNLQPNTVAKPNVPTKLVSPNPTSGYTTGEEDKTEGRLMSIRPDDVLRIGTYFVKISSTSTDEIAEMFEDITQDIYVNIMTISFNLLSNLVKEEIAKIKLLSPDEDLILQIVKFVFNYLKHEKPFGESCPYTDNGLTVILKEFFQEGRVKKETILILKDRFMKWIENEMIILRIMYPNKKRIICSKCQGVTFA